MRIFNLFKTHKNIAIDVGTVWTKVVYRGNVVINAPSVIALKNEEVVAVGIRALEMESNPPLGVKVIHPIKDGVISDYIAIEKLVQNLLTNTFGRCGTFGQKLNMGWVMPTGITEADQCAIRDIASHLGDGAVRMVYTPLAATIGIGKNVNSPEGRMIIDVGPSTTDISTVSLGGLVNNTSILTDWKKENTKCFEKIADAVGTILEQTPPELRNDIEKDGAYLIGDGAFLKGLDSYLQHRFGISFHIAKDPELAAVIGADFALQYKEHYFFFVR